MPFFEYLFSHLSINLNKQFKKRLRLYKRSARKVEVADSKLPRGCDGEREDRLSPGDEEYSSPATVLIIQDAYLIGWEDLGKRK